ncbi:acyl-CoA thioester hydrolase, YbgC/YbaW family [Arthrobacter subterraneus]|uniref:Acyl-CoA thioester hydrolase, YbgC/YbaW family n=2 Tax=Arthrobacter subterraneus TaxID=335973 RepID=A0A1G8K2X9_9MICC|nr:acyl-CoA thioester hydrolase, YbgC/YbaW family [Arthrobacter subterraneus]
MMHLILRTLWTLFASRRRPKLSVWDSASLPLRVQLTDIDIAMHVNNGMYLALMDLGRFDLMIRSGVWRIMRRRGWTPVVNAETITFRKSLQLGQRYTIETRILGFDERAIFFEQRMVHDGEIYARAYIATRLLSSQGPVPNEEIFEALGNPPEGLVLPDWIHEWRLNTALPSTRKPARHEWVQ